MVDKMVRVSPWEKVGIVGSKQAPIFTYYKFKFRELKMLKKSGMKTYIYY